MALPTSPYFGLTTAAGRYAMVPAYSPYAMYRVAAAPVYYSVVATQRSERDRFYEQLHAFRASIGQPIVRLPTLGFKELDLWTLYREVTRRNGIDAVIARKQWKEVAEALRLPSSCTDSGFRLRLHYKKYLEAFERKYFSPPNPATPGNSARVEPPRRKKRRASSPLPQGTNSTATTSNPAILDTNAAGADGVAPRSASASTLCSVGLPTPRDGLMASQPAAVWTPATPLKSSMDPPTSPAHSSASGTDTSTATTATTMTTNGLQTPIEQQPPSPAPAAASVDFTQLEESSVRRYARKHRVTQMSEHATLAAACTAHFSHSTLEESEARIIGEFLATMKQRRKHGRQDRQRFGVDR